MDETLLLEERIKLGIALGESHFREFKSGVCRTSRGELSPRPVRDICQDVGEELVAFANADGGELLIGVEDDGTITGIPHLADEIERIIDAYTTHVHAKTPLPSPITKEVEINEKKILYFRVTKSVDQVHLTFDGRCLQRFDRERIPVPPESIQYSRQEEKSRQFDRQFVLNATVADLDVDLLDSISQQVAPGYSPEKLLQFLDLAEFDPDGLKLRKASLLLFGREVVKWHPRCTIRILRIRGTDLGTGKEYNVSEDDTVSGNIIEILENTWERLRPHLARTRFSADAIFRESIIYPEDACRETLINAVAHRDYSYEGNSIEILIFDDRMEIRSPGRLLSSVSVEDLKTLKGTHQSRNVFTARVLRELGYMREMGEGMRRIFTSVRDHDLVDPLLRNDQASFVVTLFHRSVFSPKDIQWLSGFSEFDLSKNEQRVVLLGSAGRLLSTAEIIRTLGIVDTEDFRALYETLNRKGVIFSAKRPTGKKRRQVPRFQIRPPAEANQFLAELQSAINTIGESEKLDREYAKELRSRISTSSPFHRNPLWALRALGYISNSNQPLPRITRIWAAEQVKPDISESPFETGVVTNILRESGYAFATTQSGVDYFLHISNFVKRDEFDRLRLRSIVTFLPAEMRIQGKSPVAKEIRIRK